MKKTQLINNSNNSTDRVRDKFSECYFLKLDEKEPNGYFLLVVRIALKRYAHYTMPIPAAMLVDLRRKANANNS